MAGGGAPVPTKGGKKSVDFVVNLVPTIDLLSVLVAFLLITAVWTELARIETGQLIQKPASTPKNQPQRPRQDLMLLLHESGDMQLKFTGKEPTTIKGGSGVFSRFRLAYDKDYKDFAAPDQKIIVAAQDGVPYSRLIQLLDVCLDMDLTALAIGATDSFE